MTPPNKQKRTSYRQEWDGDIQELTCIGNGVSGIVFAIDELKVAKIALGTTRSSEDIETERKVYRRLKQRRKKAKCQYIVKCYETDNPRGIVLERCKESVRSRIRSSLPLPSEQKTRLAREATEGLAYLHDGGIVQGDG
jgi:serine/threonine protein kinase